MTNEDDNMNQSAVQQDSATLNPRTAAMKEKLDQHVRRRLAKAARQSAAPIAQQSVKASSQLINCAATTTGNEKIISSVRSSVGWCEEPAIRALSLLVFSVSNKYAADLKRPDNTCDESNNMAGNGMNRHTTKP